MSEIGRLAQDIAADGDLRRNLMAASTLEQAVQLANGSGYAVTTDEAMAFIDTLQSESRQELSDNELDAVSGGKASKASSMTDISAQGSAQSNRDFAAAFFVDLGDRFKKAFT